MERNVKLAVELYSGNKPLGLFAVRLNKNLEKMNSIYIDIKDTRGEEKVKKLHDCLCRNKYDFDRDIIQKVQQVRSHELELVALADLFVGAMSYVHRNLSGSDTKLDVIDRIKKLSHYSLLKSTLYREDKFNIFVWHQS